MTASDELRRRADEAKASAQMSVLISDDDGAKASFQEAAELRALADLAAAERAFAAREPDSSFAEYQRLVTALKVAGDNVERAFKEQGK